ncbi:MAG: PASTA domain-containing protein [Nitrospira sp.]|nr:PASTA domain-containing protein [Nitrospira sp.]
MVRSKGLNKDLHKFIRYPLYIFAFILLGLIFGYLTFKALSFSRTVDVPDLYGKSPLESNKLLSDKGLYLKIEGEDYDSTVATGNIIRQDVPAGKKVKERRGIKVVISKGPRVKSVPMIENETITNAESILLQKGLKIARLIMVHSDIVEKDRIIAQRPGPEEQVKDMITVLVSLGPYEYIYNCPDFKGMSLEQANMLIKKLNLKLLTEGSGEMIGSQKPEPGKQIKTGDTIYLKLS